MVTNTKKKLRIAGGILTIIGGLIIIVGVVVATGLFWGLIPEGEPPPVWVFGQLIAVGIVALVGGISAVRGRIWGLALAGAICAAFPATPIGILAIIFIAMTKREFA